MVKTKGESQSIAAIKRHRTAKLAALGTRAYYLHRRGQDDKMWSLICDEMLELGGIYIKFLQGVLLQSQAVHKWQNPDQLKIFENLDHEPIDIIKLLRSELSTDKLSQIVSVQPQPFAAGSFGQVYYGQHKNGKPIIIKALRPMVKELLKYDLRLLSVFSRTMVNKMSTNVDINLDGAIKDFRAATLSETDYIAEARFASELYSSYKDNPKFIIPETFLDLCTRNIIVQEYVDGLSVAQLLRLKEQGVDPKLYVQETIGSDLDVQLTTLGVELLDGAINLSRIQGDPHPGNIRLLTENRVGMIDFGIAASSPENKAAFFGIIMAWDQLYKNNLDLSYFFEQFVRFFVNDLYRALKRLGSFNYKQQSPAEERDYTKTLGRLAHETFKNTLGVNDIKPLIEDGKIIQIINQMINKNNRFGMVLKLEASEILRASQTYMTLVTALERRNQVLPVVFSEAVQRITEQHPELLHETEDNLSISEALDVVSQWLERVANRDPALFQQLVGRIKLSSSKIKPVNLKNTGNSSSVNNKEKINA